MYSSVSDSVAQRNTTVDTSVTNASTCFQTREHLLVCLQASCERNGPLCRQRHLSGYRCRTLTHTVTLTLCSGMWVSRPGLGLETDQDHFFEVLVLVSTLLVLVLVLASLVLVSACLVLVLVSEGGLEQDLRLCVC